MGCEGFGVIGGAARSARGDGLGIVIPYSNQIRQADRIGISVLDNLNKDLFNRFMNILQKLEERIGT